MVDVRYKKSSKQAKNSLHSSNRVLEDNRSSAQAQMEFLPHEARHVVYQKNGGVKPAVKMMLATDVNGGAGLGEKVNAMEAKAMKFLNNQPEAVAQRKLSEMFNQSSGTVQSPRSSTLGIIQLNPKKTKRLSRGQKKARKKRDKKQYQKQQDRIMAHAAKQKWRIWHQGEGISGAVEETTGVPESTAQVPKKLYHITHYASLPNIKKNGLDPKRVNSKGGLNAASPENLKYRMRDAALKATYLGTSTRPGLSMSSESDLESGGKVPLMIKVPKSFALAYFRYSWATGSASKIDNKKTGDTVLSFARIKPKFIFLQTEWLGDIPISSFGNKTDWRRHAKAPKGGTYKNLKTTDELKREEKAKLERVKKFKEAAENFVPLEKTIIEDDPKKPESNKLDLEKIMRNIKLMRNEESDNEANSEDGWSE